MDFSSCGIFIVLLCVVDHVTGTCVEPLSLPASQITRISELKSAYALRDPVVYQCDTGNGWGYITIRCEEAGAWGAADRLCLEGAVVESGSIAGIVVAGCTILITISFIVIATIKKKKDEKAANCETAEMKEENGNGTAIKA